MMKVVRLIHREKAWMKRLWIPVEGSISPDTLKPMADVLRLVGNSAVHRVSEIDFSQSNEEAHEIADLLSEFLNQIVDSFLARPGKATELIQRVLARKKKR